jgi:O-antigen/teichoic acid export membrane protein
MKEHFTNAAFGALDYIAYPAGMLLLAPAILRVLGIYRYGVWAMASAVLMTGAILASGFGDANIRAVAQARGSRQSNEAIETVRSALGIHLALGVLIASMCWIAAPALTQHAIKTHSELFRDCLWSLRITAVLILLRAIETVCVSTQRAFSRYGAAIQVSVIARLLSLLVAWLTPQFENAVAIVMVTMLIVNLLALWIQIRQLKSLLGIRHIAPSLHAQTTRALLGFGVFTWLQAVAGLLFGQVDRLVAGAALGTSAITVYTFCVQLTQPIYGIAAAGLHFLFPHLASDAARGSRQTLLRPILGTLAANFCFVAAALAVLLLYGKVILRFWAGSFVARDAVSVLPVAAWGSALSALSVTGSYSLLALGKPRAVTLLSIFGGLAMAAALAVLVPRYGLTGIALSRLLPGIIALLVYIPLAAMLMKHSAQSTAANRHTVCEEV